jgi:arylsulfatase A
LSVESNRGLDRIALNETTMANDLARADYRTGMIGKWHNGLHDLRFLPRARGFQHFVGFCNGGMGYYDWILERNGAVEQSDGRYLTDVFTEEAVAFIERQENDPFFLYLAYNAPHAPLEAPGERVRPYLEKTDLNPGVATLYAMVEQMDAGIGRILDSLDRSGMAENTIVVLTSDNGPWLGSDSCAGIQHPMMRTNGPFRGMKQDVLEGGIRVPCIVRWPAGLPEGTVGNAVTRFLDWRPSFNEVAGTVTTSPHPLDGGILWPLLRGESTEAAEITCWQYNRYDSVGGCNGAVREGDWKLYWPRIPEAMEKLDSDNSRYYELFHRPHYLSDIANPRVNRQLSPARPPELYNLAEDPGESRNLANDHPERTARLQTILKRWFDQVNGDRFEDGK